jgi:hypothetical protein
MKTLGNNIINNIQSVFIGHTPVLRKKAPEWSRDVRLAMHVNEEEYRIEK